MHPRRHTLAVCVPLAVLALAGCGGGDGGDGDAQPSTTPSAAGLTPSAAGLSKASYLSASEKLCSKEIADFQVLNERFTDPKGNAQVVAYFDGQVSLARPVVVKLTALADAQPDRQLLQRIFTGPSGRSIEVLSTWPGIVRRSGAASLDDVDSDALPALPQGDEKAMRAYGFDACADLATSE